jgi:hypothetical protein
MFSENSPFRRMPGNLNPNIAHFIDGIRHSMDIMRISYGRLEALLTDLALNPPSNEYLPEASANAFLDAWAFNDAVDKFRQFYKKFPRMTFSEQPGLEPLEKALDKSRKIRNKADHPPGAAQDAVYSGHGALGTLTWITPHNTDENVVWFCSLRPGTFQKPVTLSEKPFQANLMGRPTECICLELAGIKTNLSEMLQPIGIRVAHLEQELSKAFSAIEFKDSRVVNDLFTRQGFRLHIDGNIKTSY